jgi:predicted acetyltransferase
MMFLQGIYGFYERFGFESILKQSKIVVDLRRFNSELAPSVREANYRDLEDLSKTHHEMISKMLFCSDRSEQLWEFLILQGRYTRLFYSPRIVSTDSTDAYFTIDEIEPYRIREHAFGLRPNAAESLIASLKQYQIENKLDFLEIMSSRESELVALLSQKCSLVITEYLKVNEGFLARIVNHKALFGRDEVLQVFQKKISSCVGKEAALTSDGESLKILDIDGKTLSVVDGTLLMGVLFGRFNFDINLRTPRSSAYTGGMNPQSFCLQAESL